MTSTPNLYRFATKELAQDATLAYLLAWANPSCRNSYPDLHRLGTSLIEALFRQYNRMKAPEVTAIEIGTQVDRIDVLARINDENEKGVLLQIEDKVGSDEHSNQIERYIETAIEDLGDGGATGFRVAPELALDDRQAPLLAHVGEVDGTSHGGQLATERNGGSERVIDLCDGQDFRRLEQKPLQPVLVIPANPGFRLQSASAQRNRAAVLQLWKVDRLAVFGGCVSPIHRPCLRRGCGGSRSGPERPRESRDS